MWRTPTTPRTPVPPEPAPRAGYGRWLRALAAAIAIQLAAAGAIFLAGLVYFLALISIWKTDDPTPWWIIFSFLIAVAAIVMWIWSGSVAARIAGSRLGWIVLLLGPLAVTIVFEVAGS